MLDSYQEFPGWTLRQYIVNHRMNENIENQMRAISSLKNATKLLSETAKSCGEECEHLAQIMRRIERVEDELQSELLPSDEQSPIV